MSSTSNSNETAITEAEVAKFEQQVTKTRRTRKQFDHARAVQLRIRERLTYDEIAERMDTTRAVVCTNIHKFLKYLEGDSDDVPGNLYAYQANKPDLLETVEYKLLDTVYDILSTGRTPPAQRCRTGAEDDSRNTTIRGGAIDKQRLGAAEINRGSAPKPSQY